MSALLRPAPLISLPTVWQGSDLAAETSGLPTGHPALDAELPGGGWPPGSLVELLQLRAHAHVWQLVLPALAVLTSRQAGPVVLVGAPLLPFAPSLAAQGLPPHRLLCIHADKPAARLWAAEQALRCADVAAVLAWLPQARSTDLRRLHLAAHQQRRLLFVMRAPQARHQASPARLRLLLEGVDEIQVHIVKRRGPPLASPVVLPAWSQRLQALLQARRSQTLTPLDTQPRRSHVLDRPLAIT